MAGSENWYKSKSTGSVESVRFHTNLPVTSVQVRKLNWGAVRAVESCT